MAEYIEREALIADIDAAMDNAGMGYVIGQTLKRYVKRVPAADVAPVKHGRWETVIDCDEFWGELDYYKCSLCGKMELRDSQTLYCPNCGADMRPR